jgi:hypothetical protein
MYQSVFLHPIKVDEITDLIDPIRLGFLILFLILFLINLREIAFF